MTKRERHLTERIAKLRDEHDRLLAETRLLREGRIRARAIFRHCVYCGRWCHGLVCAMHEDLVRLDPVYSPEEAVA